MTGMQKYEVKNFNVIIDQLKNSLKKQIEAH